MWTPVQYTGLYADAEFTGKESDQWSPSEDYPEPTYFQILKINITFL